MLEVLRLTHQHEMYGFHFAQASLRAVDYNWEIDALVWLDTLTTDSPEANYAMQKELFARKKRLQYHGNQPGGLSGTAQQA